MNIIGKCILLKQQQHQQQQTFRLRMTFERMLEIIISSQPLCVYGMQMKYKRFSYVINIILHTFFGKFSPPQNLIPFYKSNERTIIHTNIGRGQNGFLHLLRYNKIGPSFITSRNALVLFAM